MNLRVIYFLMALLFVITGCKKDRNEEETIDPESGEALFVSATSAGSFTKVQLQAAASANGFAAYVPFILYDVDYYKFTYKTTLNGNKIQASGLLGIPKGMTTTPALLSAQHGTMFADADAPSNFPTAFTGFELFASAGFITVIPDYIGFGASKDIAHPYYDMQSSGIAVVDMIKAAKHYLKAQIKLLLINCSW